MNTFTLQARGPFSFERSLDVVCHFPPLQRHTRGGDGRLRMAFTLDGDFTPVAVALRDEGDGLSGEVVGTDKVDVVRAQVARIFSLDHDATGFAEVGRREPKIGAIMRQLEGLRPVCFTSPYECAAWAILSQRIAATQAARISMRLAEAHGTRLTIAGETAYAFPTPERLAAIGRLGGTTPNGIDEIPGVAAIKVARLRGVAEAAMEGRLDAARLRAMGHEAAIASLREIPGIGAFWSAGIYLRACGVTDVFAEEPLSIAALGALYGLGDRPARAKLDAIVDRLRPFRMWTCFLLRVAAARGIIRGVSGRESAIRRAGPMRRTSSRGAAA